MESAGLRRGGRAVLTFLATLLWSPPPAARWPMLLTEACVALGAAGGFAFLVSAFDWPATVMMALATTLVHVAATQGREGRAWSILRWTARVPYALVALFMVYQSASFGYMLAWAVPAWAIGLTLAFALGAVATSRAAWTSLRVPTVLPLGVWIAACLLAWRTEMFTLRCDDHRRAIAQPGVDVVAPATARQAQCAPGERLFIRYYPRKIWPSPLGEGRYILALEGDGHQRPDILPGALCELRTEPTRSVACGHPDSNYSYGVAFGSDPSELFVVGDRGLLRTRAEPPFEVLAHVKPPGRIPMNVLFDPRTEQLTVFFDEIDMGQRYRASDLAVVDTRPLRLAPEEIRFDPVRGEGIYCFASTPLFRIQGKGYLARAFADDPLETRPLGSSDQISWTALAFSDGCDIDLERRRAYVGIGTLGLITEIDYDSGAVLGSHWAGFGVRPVLLAPDRRHLYFANYLSGEVWEMAIDGWRVTRRWFAGRFIRHLYLNAKSHELFVTSTLGVTRIDLSVPREEP